MFALNPELAGDGMNVIRTLAEENMTMVMVICEMGVAGHRASFMDHRVIAEDESPDDVQTCMETALAALSASL